MSYPYEPRLAMTKKWGLSWEEVYYYELVELEKEPSLSTYVIEYSMGNKASTE